MLGDGKTKQINFFDKKFRIVFIKSEKNDIVSWTRRSRCVSGKEYIQGVYTRSIYKEYIQEVYTRSIYKEYIQEVYTRSIYKEYIQ